MKQPMFVMGHLFDVGPTGTEGVQKSFAQLTTAVVAVCRGGRLFVLRRTESIEHDFTKDVTPVDRAALEYKF